MAVMSVASKEPRSGFKWRSPVSSGVEIQEWAQENFKSEACLHRAVVTHVHASARARTDVLAKCGRRSTRPNLFDDIH